jgi:hypothetical protein
MRSTETLSKPARRKNVIASYMSVRRCARRHVANKSSSKLWAPTLARLTPALRNAAAFAESNVAGSISHVISASASMPNASSTRASSRCRFTAEIKLGVPPPRYTDVNGLRGRPA